MESEAWHQTRHLVGEITTIPEAFDFFQAVRVLKRTLNIDKGQFVEFKVNRALNFPRASVVKVLLNDQSTAKARYQMFVTFIGLFGQSGVLPQHYTELLLERLSAKDAHLTEFLDIFNQRVIELCYQIWANNRFYVSGHEGVDHKKSVMAFLSSLTGVLGSEKSSQGMADMELYYAGLYGKQNRPSEGLKIMLEDYFDVPVKISHFLGEWLKIDVKERSVLSSCHKHKKTSMNQIGVNCMMGAKVWHVQNRFEVIVGPVNYAQFQSLLPDGAMLATLKRIVENYVGYEYQFNVKVLLRAEDVPRCYLGQGSAKRLGWDSWFFSKPLKAPKTSKISKTLKTPVDVVQVKLTRQALLGGSSFLNKVLRQDQNQNQNQNQGQGQGQSFGLNQNQNQNQKIKNQEKV